MKVGFFDIEATNLNASFGMLLSACTKPLDEPVKKMRIPIRSEIKPGKHDPIDELAVKQIISELNKYDAVVTWYGKKYDIPFIKTRALKYGISDLIDTRIKHIDLYYTAKYKLKMHSNRLEAVAEFLGIDGKTKISSDAWNRAARGDKEAMEEVIHHNVMDVIVLEKVYKKLVREITSISRI